MRILVKTISVILSSIFYCATCAVLTAWLYRMGPVEHVLHWHSWAAAIEMAMIMTVLNITCWLVLLAFRSKTSLWVCGLSGAVVTAITTEVYIALMFQFENGYPLLTVFGKSAASLFEDDAGILYAMIVAPAMAILSGSVLYTIARLYRWTDSQTFACSRR